MFPYLPKICFPSLIGTCLNLQKLHILKGCFGIFDLHLIHLSLCLQSLQICLFFPMFKFWHNTHFFTNVLFKISWSFSKLCKHSEPIVISLFNLSDFKTYIFCIFTPHSTRRRAARPCNQCLQFRIEGTMYSPASKRRA